MSDVSSVFLVDDDKDLLNATKQTLELAGFSVSAFSTAADALGALAAGFAGVIVSDIRMPQMDGQQLFSRVKEQDADLPVILVTGHGDIPMAVKAIQDGAYDFLTKPFATDRLVQSVRRAAEKRRLVLENRALRIAAEQAQGDLPLIGQTPAMERLRHTLRQIADTDVDVLVTGETGSGKEVVASLLHRWSLSATSLAPSPARRRSVSAASNMQAPARCFSMRSRACRRQYRCRCCVSWRCAR
jgi:two-component system C4-dicarboxylate transport response regulator DctD